jgi:hypothetical protein
MIKKFLLAKLVYLLLVGTLWASTCLGSSTPSNEVTVTIPATGTHTVLLTWQASTTPVVKYTVNRGVTSGGEGSYSINIKSLNFTDTHVVDGLTYVYTVNAVCIVAPGTPTGLSGQTQ